MKINIIRCILIFLVILIHCTPFKDSYPNVQNAILAFVVPLFLFITGYLFNVRKTWREFAHYLTRLLMIYAIFEMAYIILSYYFPVRDSVTELTATVILNKLILHPLGPYWYLHTMIICSCIYYMSHRISCYLGNDITISLSIFLGVTISYYSTLLGIMSPLAYLAGVYARNSSKYFGDIFKGSFMAIPIAIITLFYGISSNHEYASQLTFFSILLGIYTIESIVFCTERMPIKICRIMDYIGGNTLPIYLFHPLFTLLSKHLLRDLIEKGYIISYSMIVIASATVGSILIGYVMDIAGISRLILHKNMLRLFNHSQTKGR